MLTSRAGLPMSIASQHPTMLTICKERAMLNPASSLPLKDPTLFRSANYIDGKWVQADSGKTLSVKNPAYRRGGRHGAGRRRRRDPPRDRGGGQGVPPLARPARQGTLGHPAPLVRADARQHRGSRRHHDGRAGQAADREPGRDRLRRKLHRMVRRRGQARLRRHHPAERRRAAASSCSRSRSASSPPSRRGTSRPP